MESKYEQVLGSKMHYIEAGHGAPILLLHGVPASSYVWRNVIPHLTSLGRCIAPDLIGFGKSDKPDIAYSINDHIRYIEAFIDALNLKHLTLVMHGWGSVIGFDYAMRHEDNCRGLVFYEAFLKSMEDEEAALPFCEQMARMQDEALVDKIMNTSYFVDHTIPESLIRKLTDTEMKSYQAPFNHRGAGKPILQYLSELPNGGDESISESLIARYTQKLQQSTLPKLMLYSLPGYITTMENVMWAKAHLPKLEIADIGEELHFAQESRPEMMGEMISVWLQGVDQYGA